MLLQAAWLFKAVGWKQTNSEKSERGMSNWPWKDLWGCY